ncbi:unnamed protein product [Dicrocoelium dendriticum]|nr:unnamed protein product [Dicrocoelium dendriticum]
MPSGYQFNFLKKETCKLLCSKTYTSSSDTRYHFLRSAAILQYSHHWVVDNLPVTVCLTSNGTKRYCSVSIPLGCFGESRDLFGTLCSVVAKSKNDVYLFNHAKFTIYYHRVQDSWSGGDISRIVGIVVEPRSINHSPTSLDCDSVRNPLLLPAALNSNLYIAYTYSVVFEPSNIKWASRWDYILEGMPQSNIHWISILNSVVLVLFLSGLVATILLRTLRRDITRYSQLENSSDVQEESGWKLVHGDVFRPPTWGMLLSVYLGSGSQLFLMLLSTLFFACLGFLSPANRGALMTCALATYACSGALAGRSF